MKVGVSMMFGGLTGAPGKAAAAVQAQADVILVSYYPLTPGFQVRDPKVVHADFDVVCKLYPRRTIHFIEAGYPSGPKCNSSEAKQKQFIDEIFSAWDEHADQIHLVLFVWLTDVPASAVAGFTSYYGVKAPAFAEYLATLGLRTNPGAGTDKPAFTALKQQAKARGW